MTVLLKFVHGFAFVSTDANHISAVKKNQFFQHFSKWLIAKILK